MANIRTLGIQAIAVPFYEECKNQLREFFITEKQNMWIFENLVISSFIGAPNLHSLPSDIKVFKYMDVKSSIRGKNEIHVLWLQNFMGRLWKS
jgi:hypothetical protein